MDRTTALFKGIVVLLAIIAFVVWLMWTRLKKTDDPAQLVFRWGLTVGIFGAAWFTVDFTSDDAAERIGGVLLGAVYGLLLALLWGRALGELVGNRVAGLFDGGDVAADPRPCYSITEARIKQGHYREAIYEIQGQLARFPTDVTGQMMMAEIQGAHLNDLPAAQNTIERFCHQPGHPPKNIAYALNLLADLHLKYGLDPGAARAAFEQIIELLPGTEEAHQARQRIAHLASPEYLVAQRDRPPIQLKAGERDLGLRQKTTAHPAADRAPEAQVAEYVNQLELYPNDDETRAKLAVLYAEHYQRLDLAVEQLEQLMAQPNLPPKQGVHYLNLLADLQIKLGVEFETVQQTLQRIIDLNPQLAAAENARHRLALLKLEYKRNEKSQTLKLGAYEKDLGLKNHPHDGKPWPPPSEHPPVPNPNLRGD